MLQQYYWRGTFYFAIWSLLVVYKTCYNYEKKANIQSTCDLTLDGGYLFCQLKKKNTSNMTSTVITPYNSSKLLNPHKNMAWMYFNKRTVKHKRNTSCLMQFIFVEHFHLPVLPLEETCLRFIQRHSKSFFRPSSSNICSWYSLK